MQRGDDEQRRPGYLYDPAAPLPEHLRPAPEQPLPKGRLRDFDSAESVYRLKTFTWSLTGLLLGLLLGFLISLHRGTSPVPTMIVSGLVLWAVAFFGTRLLSERVAVWGSTIYFSGSSRLPVRRDYSLAESLVVRGRLAEGAAEYERAASRHADDPEPCLRLARLLRDQLGRPEDAVTWFRRGLARIGPEAAAGIGVQRELIELLLYRLKQPRRALPELARLAALQPDSVFSEWARRELAELRRTTGGGSMDG